MTVERCFSFPWEVALTEWLQAHMGPAAVTAASLLSLLGEPLAVVAIVGFLYWCADKEFGKSVGVSLAAAVVLNCMTKNLVLRRRPYFDHTGIRCLKPVESGADIYDLRAQGYSFPSGHSSTAAAAYPSVALGRPRRWLTTVAVLLPLLVGLSRVCLGVHYPTDVLAGWALGLLAAFGLGRLQRRTKRKWALYLVLILAALPGWFFCRSDDYYSGFGLMLGILASILFEERFVRFANTRRPLRALARLAGGLGLFWAVSTACKLPFSAAFLSGGSLPAHLVRAGRYAVSAFAVMGLYPMLFRYTDRLR